MNLEFAVSRDVVSNILREFTPSYSRFAWHSHYIAVAMFRSI